MVYLQAYTNTYAPLSVLKTTSDPSAQRDDIMTISTATYTGRLENNKIAYLQPLCAGEEIWVELELQSIHDDTAQHINRRHICAQFLDCVERLSHTDLKIAVHLMSSLPDEDKLQTLGAAAVLVKLPVHAIKTHMLHIMESARITRGYRQPPFVMLSREEYIDIVIRRLGLLLVEIITQRLAGDSVKEALITPLWILKEVTIFNDIDKEME